MPAQTLKSFFGALASLNRLSILFLLASGEKKVAHLSHELALEQSVVSHGLRRLSSAGLIFVRKEGRERYYRLNQQTSAHVFALANSLELQGTARLTDQKKTDYLAIIDKDHRIMYFRNFTGNEFAMDVLGKSIYDFIPKFFRAIAKRRLEKVFRSPKPLRWKIPAFDDRMRIRWYSTEMEPLGGSGDGSIANAMIVSASVTGSPKKNR